MKDEELNQFLLTGQYNGSAGAGVIVKNCIARCNNSNVRQVDGGDLVQVWSYYDDVKFSIFHYKHYLQLDNEPLICKQSDIARVPPLLWGALLPLSPQERIFIAQNQCLAESLADIREGHNVDIHDNLKFVDEAVVITRLCNPSQLIGVYYGIKFKNYHNFESIVSLVAEKDIPPGCDAVVNLRSFVNKSTMAERENRGYNISKSLSHNTLPICPDSDRVSKRYSRSLDTTQKIKSVSDTMHKPLNCNSVSVHVATTHCTSRSLDLPPTKRLTRDRACASLDSGSCTLKNTELGKGQFINIDDLTVGSMIEFMTRDVDEPCYGVIRWIGRFPEGDHEMAGVELEEEIEEDIDTLGLFKCQPNKAYFVKFAKCRRDSRFQDSHRRSLQKAAFGQKECPIVEGVIPPICRDVLNDICGKNKGIQGHNNSCYLDATLFAMFAFTSVFDSVLYRPPVNSCDRNYSVVQRVLRDEIVNPLRKNAYVRADRVLKLRTLLDKLSSVTGLISEEKDPEEFLNSLLMQTLKAEPFLQLSSGQEAFYYQLFVEKDERLHVPSVQQLIEQSFLSSDIKLEQLPSCLIVQMPRFGKTFKMYPRIIPSTTIDVTDLIVNSPRQCVVCGKLAQFECKECYNGAKFDGGSFCYKCRKTAHDGHPTRQHHKSAELLVPTTYLELLETRPVPRLTMQLFAVLCIETSHYVAFIRTEEGWIFFDSMADRKGEQNGYNIPEIVSCPELSFWLSEEGARHIAEVQDERDLPPLTKRLLCDAYMCMYQSPQVMMYR